MRILNWMAQEVPRGGEGGRQGERWRAWRRVSALLGTRGHREALVSGSKRGRGLRLETLHVHGGPVGLEDGGWAR